MAGPGLVHYVLCLNEPVQGQYQRPGSQCALILEYVLLEQAIPLSFKKQNAQLIMTEITKTFHSPISQEASSRKLQS